MICIFIVGKELYVVGLDIERLSVFYGYDAIRSHECIADRIGISAHSCRIKIIGGSKQKQVFPLIIIKVIVDIVYDKVKGEVNALAVIKRLFLSDVIIIDDSGVFFVGNSEVLVQIGSFIRV